MSSEFPWAISVVTSETIQAKKELGNACLYGDKVIVICTNGLVSFLEAAIEEGIRIDAPEIHKKHVLEAGKAASRFEEYSSIIKSVEESGVKPIIPNFRITPAECMPPDIPEDDNWLDEFTDYWIQAVTQDGIDLTQAVISNIPMNNWLGLRGGWCPHSASHALLHAMEDLNLLPDVSHLPLSIIGEMKERLKDEFDPMRAELLRFTEHLRAEIDRSPPYEDIINEARVLVATKVEPLVRESAKHSSELLNNRYKKFLKTAPKTLGLVGLGFINPGMFIEKASTEALDASNRLAGVLGDSSTPSATTRFVLEINRIYSNI